MILLVVKTVLLPDVLRAQPSGTLSENPSGDLKRMKAWLSGMSPGGLTSGAKGVSEPAADAAFMEGTRIAAARMLDRANRLFIFISIFVGRACPGDSMNRDTFGHDDRQFTDLSVPSPSGIWSGDLERILLWRSYPRLCPCLPVRA